MLFRNAVCWDTFSSKTVTESYVINMSSGLLNRFSNRAVQSRFKLPSDYAVRLLNHIKSNSTRKVPSALFAGARPSVWEVSHRYRQIRTTTYSGSSFFESEIVRQEIQSIYKQLEDQMKLWPKFPDFDSQGKRYFIDASLSLLEKLDINLRRMELSDDPVAKEVVRNYNIQMLEGNVNRKILFEQYGKQVKHYRMVVEEEEKLANNPDKLFAFQKRFKVEWDKEMRIPNLLSKLDLESNPEILEMMTDSKALAAIGDVLMDKRDVEKYRERPILYKGLKKILELAGEE